MDRLKYYELVMMVARYVMYDVDPRWDTPEVIDRLWSRVPAWAELLSDDPDQAELRLLHESFDRL